MHECVYLYCTDIEQSDSKGTLTMSYFDLEGLHFSFKLRNQTLLWD